MKRLLEITDRLGGLLSLCGLIASLWMLADAQDVLHAFWGVCALVLAGVALWANFEEVNWHDDNE
ncbi:MAG: hypothetical protein ACP5RV_12595 [Thiomonas sp.]